MNLRAWAEEHRNGEPRVPNKNYFKKKQKKTIYVCLIYVLLCFIINMKYILLVKNMVHLGKGGGSSSL